VTKKKKRFSINKVPIIKKGKKSKNKLILRGKLKADLNGFQIVQFNDEFIAEGKPGAKRDTPFICTSKKAAISFLSVDKDGLPGVTAYVTLDQLDRFMKSLKKDLPSLRKINKKTKTGNLCLRHLSSDITFVVRNGK
jgi:hypothetical protein